MVFRFMVGPGVMAHAARCAAFPSIVRLVWSTTAVMDGTVGTAWTWGWSSRKGSGIGGRIRENRRARWLLVAAAREGIGYVIQPSSFCLRRVENRDASTRSWVIEPCADYWKTLPRHLIRNEILPQIAYVDTLPPARFCLGTTVDPDHASRRGSGRTKNGPGDDQYNSIKNMLAMTIHRVFSLITLLATRAWLRPVSRGNRHFTVGGGRLRQSSPRPEARLLRRPALEGLMRSARTDSPRQVCRNKFRRSGGGGGGF
ncbi:hypothetical protein F511_03470 [Dorcoceras hygrometricum]|uniref:Uncharacterized protein n=1 Tax=Dorcoceras hygrometricum TaxID=472368 RepID=A0A2Z7AI85_9LAMI|nr:hypothetical protein F511_03470 [Dorcoceras hygrometricum]